MLSKTIEVSYFFSVSLDHLIEKLKLVAKYEDPFPKDVAVGLDIVYRLNSTPWRKHRGDKVCHHLSMPSAATVASQCDKALCQAGFLKPGQATIITTAKFVDDTETNVLKVTINQVTERLKEDKDFFKLKLLKWYTNHCVEHGVEPKFQQFKVMCKALAKKQKKLSFDPTKIDLSKPQIE